MHQQGKAAEAIDQYQQALSIDPRYAAPHNNLANLLCSQGRIDEAVAHGRKALEIDPQLAEAHCNLAIALVAQGKADETIAHCQAALKIKPDFAEARGVLGRALLACGRKQEAIAEWREALRLQPNDLALLDLLARVLATCPEAPVRNGAEAVQLAERAVRLSGGQAAELLDTLAAAYAEAGRFSVAVTAAQRAAALAAARGDRALANALQARIQLYQAGTPLRESRLPPEHERSGGTP